MVSSSQSYAINKSFQEIPELRKSIAAQFPLELPQWVDPSHKVNNKIAAFIPYQRQHNELVELRHDYVWGLSTHGPGYYHVHTKQAYKILLHRVRKDITKGARLISKYSPEERERRNNLKILHGVLQVRVESKRPDEFDATQLDNQRNPSLVNNGKFTRTALIGSALAAIVP
eukprot:CAMPEP_0194040146 /NCGR_PEP_ID=MMETSP0009_2-20130614/12194_1 /TAXON_ID=210454 /ORGANISM="Grammatophora oceanica, Strain CCMP 410" /LENGTH=171 /DNA_ID=CAMNT_0038683189 /DNA_START=35 /DNA_END=550 /DNA_ORIENTATION=+